MPPSFTAGEEYDIVEGRIGWVEVVNEPKPARTLIEDNVPWIGILAVGVAYNNSHLISRREVPPPRVSSRSGGRDLQAHRDIRIPLLSTSLHNLVCMTEDSDIWVVFVEGGLKCRESFTFKAGVKGGAVIEGGLRVVDVELGIRGGASGGGF